MHKDSDLKEKTFLEKVDERLEQESTFGEFSALLIFILCIFIGFFMFVV